MATDGAVVGEPVDHEVEACGQNGVLRCECEAAVFDLVVECGDDKGTAGLWGSVKVADLTASEGIDETVAERREEFLLTPVAAEVENREEPAADTQSRRSTGSTGRVTPARPS